MSGPWPVSSPPKVPPFDPAGLKEYLDGRVAKWWLPERWAQIEEVPKTSVGKFDKKVLRQRYADGETGGGGTSVTQPGPSVEPTDKRRPLRPVPPGLLRP